MLWIGLHLPRLSLEAFAATLPPAARDEPAALIEAHTVAAANAAAEHLGVRAGHRRATALALAPALRLGQADAVRDARALAAVAHAALVFTPAVSVEAGRRLVLLEVQGSLRCFGGLRALLQRLRVALEPLGHRASPASAPTAAGAAVLALWGDDAPRRHALDLPGLQAALEAAPVGLLACGCEHGQALASMGLRRLGDLRRLPRAGLVRRFGAGLLDEIDRAWGDRPDPRRWVAPPAVFEDRIELYARAERAEQVLHGARLLLARLVAWSAAQQARVCRFTVRLQHEPRHGAGVPASALEIALAEPSGDAAHLLGLLGERLGRVRLAAPTLELHLHCADIAHRPAPSAELFPAPGSEREGLGRLLERLEARLGAGRVCRPQLVEDHRPECATRLRPARERTGPPARSRAPAGAHPVWLLPAPEPLAERGHQPLLDDRPLQFLGGPERIESGWWDGAPAVRDYFVAQQADGSLVWVFRARLPGDEARGQGWYLHGLFG